jgi:acetyl-CoA acetyltransferase
MRDVAVVAFAQSHHVAEEPHRNEVEILMPVTRGLLDSVGMDSHDVGFTCSGSCDYLMGFPFAFVSALDAIGPWPPISESHVEMDGAWALYEAWVKLQHGTIDTALVYGFGKSSPGSIDQVLNLQCDPYYIAPLWPGVRAIAALQARAAIEAGNVTEKEMAEVATRSLRDAQANDYAHNGRALDVDAALAEPYVADPLRAHDCPPTSDGAAAILLAAGDKARELSERPAWIRGIDHRVDAHQLGVRDLTRATSAAIAGERAGVRAGKVDVAELHAPFSHQELLLREALGLADGVRINPSGGALGAHPVMAAGLVRIGEAAQHVWSGDADRVVATATSGPALQHNLVCVMEGEG